MESQQPVSPKEVQSKIPDFQTKPLEMKSLPWYGKVIAWITGKSELYKTLLADKTTWLANEDSKKQAEALKSTIKQASSVRDLYQSKLEVKKPDALDKFLGKYILGLGKSQSEWIKDKASDIVDKSTQQLLFGLGLSRFTGFKDYAKEFNITDKFLNENRDKLVKILTKLSDPDVSREAGKLAEDDLVKLLPLQNHLEEWHLSLSRANVPYGRLFDLDWAKTVLSNPNAQGKSAMEAIAKLTRIASSKVAKQSKSDAAIAIPAQKFLVETARALYKKVEGDIPTLTEVDHELLLAVIKSDSSYGNFSDKEAMEMLDNALGKYRDNLDKLNDSQIASYRYLSKAMLVFPKSYLYLLHDIGRDHLDSIELKLPELRRAQAKFKNAESSLEELRKSPNLDENDIETNKRIKQAHVWLVEAQSEGIVEASKQIIDEIQRYSTAQDFDMLFMLCDYVSDRPLKSANKDAIRAQRMGKLELAKMYLQGNAPVMVTFGAGNPQAYLDRAKTLLIDLAKTEDDFGKEASQMLQQIQ